MIIWLICNSLFRVAILLLAVIAITKYRHMFIRLERIGLGLMGGPGFMTINVIWERENSPFDGWAAALYTLGAVLFLTGMLWRKGRHDRNNHRQLIASQAWMKGRDQ